MSSCYKSYNSRQLRIKFEEKSSPNGVKKLPKNDIDELKDYARRLFIEVKALRSEVRQLKQMVK